MPKDGTRKPAAGARSREKSGATSETRAELEGERKSQRATRRRPQEASFVIDEQRVDSPRRQTLGMLGVMGGLTLVLWVFARSGCNAHPPRESRRPREVTTAELTRTPKDAALELVLRYESHDHSGALEIAGGELARRIEKEKAECEADPAVCAAKRKARAGKVLVQGDLLARDPESAAVRVSVHVSGEKPKQHLALLERDKNWSVLSLRPADPKLIEELIGKGGAKKADPHAHEETADAGAGPTEAGDDQSSPLRRQ